MKKRASGVFEMLSYRKLKLSLLCLAFSLVLQSRDIQAQDGVRGPELPKQPINTPVVVSTKRRSFQLALATNPPTPCELVITSSGRGRAIQRTMEGTIRPRLYTGKYSINLQCAGFEPYSLTLNVPRDISSIPHPIALQKLKVETFITTVPEAVDIFLGRERAGTSGANGILPLPPLEPGTYELSASKEGYSKKVLTIKVEPGMKPLQVDLIRDETHRRFDALANALSRDDFEQFFVIFNQLTPAERESAAAKTLIWTTLSRLRKRSLEKLATVGPDGLQIKEAELADFRRFYTQAQALVSTDNLEVDRALVLFATFWEAKQTSVEIQRNPINLELKGKLRELLAAVETLQSANAPVLIELGHMHVVIQNTSNAEQAFLTASALEPKWSIPHFALGYLHMNQAYQINDNKKLYRALLLRAAHDLKLAIARDPTFTRAYVLASFCYADAAQPGAAVETARAAVIARPTSGLANYALGYAYYSAGRKNFGLARQYLTGALVAVDDRLDASQVSRATELLLVVSKK